MVGAVATPSCGAIPPAAICVLRPPGGGLRRLRTQDGKIKTVGEFVAAHLPAYEFAQEVVRLLVEPEAQDGQRRRIVAVYLDPSNFKDVGDGHTIADQINEVLEP